MYLAGFHQCLTNICVVYVHFFFDCSSGCCHVRGPGVLSTGSPLDDPSILDEDRRVVHARKIILKPSGVEIHMRVGGNQQEGR